MDKNKILNTAVILLAIIGIVMIYIGGFYTPNIMLPPVLTGIGFFIIAWAFSALKK
ncbi:MAG: hypothetical protein J7K34_02520 [Flavobacteriaceae bacterium]|nr:hypothetical protein [Flavobacteriaceae bacterium]